ncbi:hypothetical protein ES703_71449 [subsurface metagenome]
MRVGSIFSWKDFYGQADYRIKNRLFIYLGRSPSFLDPIYAYIATTTGQTEHYIDGGRYSNNNIIWFKQGECNFDTECVLDLDRNFFDEFELKEIINKRVIGIIPDDKMRIIYEKICNNNNIGLEVRRNIHSCFNRNSITGLKKPKKKT